jgi:hypothetical protein
MKTNWIADYLSSLRTQYRALYREMSCTGQSYNVHRGSAGLVLLVDGAPCDVPLPVLVRNVQAMTEQTMLARVQTALSA